MIMDESSVVSEAVTCAIRHIGIGTGSSGKIYAYLRQKGYDPSVCDSAVSELIEREYIDDLKAGRLIIRKRTGKKQESRNLLLRRLVAEGVAPDKADILACELDDDIDTCSQLFEAWYPRLPESEVPSDLIKEFLSLAGRRGYSAEVASSAFRLWLERH